MSCSGLVALLGAVQAVFAATSSARVMTSTTYLNGPSAAHPPIVNGPWTDADHLEGTWSSKSMMVVTGPDFYDPVDELLIEPALPGISYSFTKDGFFEEALYQVTADPRNTSCSTGAVTFQHGTYNISSDGKLNLYPFADDGRQLISEPCKYNNYSQYNQYEQQELYDRFEVWVDLYYGRYRLDMYQFDGTPITPMYLVYRPAQMLPTVTMNPGVKDKINGASNAKRDVNAPIRERIRRSLINRYRTSATRDLPQNDLYNSVWWGGVSMMALGAAGWIYFA